MVKTLATVGAILIGIPVLLVVLVVSGDASSGNSESGGRPTTEALNDIPPNYMALYQAAARMPGLTWNILAAIGDVESDHGRDPDSRTPNQAGAMGPMQFLAGTWAAFGVDGNHDGRRDVYDPADAIPGAAAYLASNGAAEGGKKLERAIWHYNHADWYVRKVLNRAAEYAAPILAASGDGGTAVRAALRWLGTPYSWGGGTESGPSYGIGHGANTKGFDCSGLARYAWAQAGIHLDRLAADQYNNGPHIPRDQLQPGDLVFFATNPKNPRTIHHVALFYRDGQMIQAPQTGDVVKISQFAGVSYREREYAGATRPAKR